MAGAGDPYVYPGTDILRNIPGYRDAEDLNRFEYEQSAARAFEVRAQPLPQRFDLNHLQHIHKHLFQDVYDWAGQIRTVEIAKGNSQFARTEFIESEAKRMSAVLAKEDSLRGLNKGVFVGKLAQRFGDWNALHVFRDGNGRASREFIGQIARGAGFFLDQTKIDNERGQWNIAAQRSMFADPRALEEIFSNAIRYSRAIAFEKMPESEARHHHPDLAGAFEGLSAMTRSLEKQFPNKPETREKYIVEARHQLLNKLDQGVVPTISPKREVSSPKSGHER